MKITVMWNTSRWGVRRRALPVQRIYRPRGSRGALLALDRRTIAFEDGRVYAVYGVSVVQSGLNAGHYSNRRDAIRFILKAGRILRHPLYAKRRRPDRERDRARNAAVREPIRCARLQCHELEMAGVLLPVYGSRYGWALRRIGAKP